MLGNWKRNGKSSKENLSAMQKDPSQRTLRISAAGSRFAHARKTPRLADSASSLYTTSFPNHSAAACALFVARCQAKA
jgi:hypothetical protein